MSVQRLHVGGSPGKERARTPRSDGWRLRCGFLMPFRWALRTGNDATRPQWEKGTISAGAHEPVRVNHGRTRAVLWLWLVWFFDLAMVAALRAHLQHHRACNPARQATGVSSFVSIASSALFVVNAPGLPAHVEASAGRQKSSSSQTRPAFAGASGTDTSLVSRRRLPHRMAWPERW